MSKMVGLRISDEVCSYLDNIAADTKCTRSAVIRGILQAYVKEKKGTKQKELSYKEMHAVFRYPRDDMAKSVDTLLDTIKYNMNVLNERVRSNTLDDIDAGMFDKIDQALRTLRVDIIRNLYYNGASQTEIAKVMGITNSRVCQLIHGK